MRDFTSIVCLLAAALSGCGDPHGDPDRTSVLLVTVDTLRADHTSALGYDLDTTPALRTLAGRGTLFLRCESQHPETGPSISSLLTSRYPRETGVRENGAVLPTEFTPVTEFFAEMRYRTGAFVSCYLLKPHACGLDRGFDTYDHEMNSANLGHQDFERRAEETVARAVRWIEAGGGRPFFLWVHLYDPHGLYDPGEDLARRFLRDTERPPLPPEKLVKYQRHGESRDPDDYEARYDGEVFRADRALEDLFHAVGEETLVVVTADHGEGLGEDDYWYRHGSLLNDAALHVPLIVAGPGIPKGREEVPSLVRNLDVAPTLYDLFGSPPHPQARGRSLVPLLHGEVEAQPRLSFAEARRMGGVRDRTGIDTRYKASVTSGASRLVLWPGTGEKRLVGTGADADGLEAALKRWLLIGDRLPGRGPSSDVNDALRGLGYLDGRGKR